MKDTILTAFKDKIIIVLFVINALTALAVLILLFIWIRPSDIQIPIRYSGYDNSLYNDRWFERLALPLFIILQLGCNTWLALVMKVREYNLLAYFLLTVGVLISLCVIPVAFAITNTITL